MSDPRRARQLTKEGIRLARAGTMRDALSKLSQAVELDDQFPEGWFWLGYYIPDQNKKIEYMKRALALKPDYERAQEMLSRLQAQASAEPDDDDPFADLDTPSTSTSSGRQVSMPQVDVSSTIGDVRKQFAGENRRALIQAWRSALMFDSENSYEAFRGRTNAITTGIVIALILAMSPIILVLVSYVLNDASAEFGDFIEFLLRLFIGSLLFGIQTAIAFYAASAAAAYLARLRFESDVSANEHFGLSSLYFTPIVILGIALLNLLQVFFWLTDILEIQTQYFAAALSYSPFAVFIFFIAHVVFSNVAIHRVKSWPGIMLAITATTIFSLVFVWLLPISMPFINEIFAFS